MVVDVTSASVSDGHRDFAVRENAVDAATSTSDQIRMALGRTRGAPELSAAGTVAEAPYIPTLAATGLGPSHGEKEGKISFVPVRAPGTAVVVAKSVDIDPWDGAVEGPVDTTRAAVSTPRTLYALVEKDIITPPTGTGSRKV